MEDAAMLGKGKIQEKRKTKSWNYAENICQYCPFCVCFLYI